MREGPAILASHSSYARLGQMMSVVLVLAISATLSIYWPRWRIDSSIVRHSVMKTRAKEYPKVAWLMSFPNSGTSYTLLNTYTVSQHAVATNYEREIKYDPPEMLLSDGVPSPYKFRTNLPTPEYYRYILTKTHCGAYGETSTPTLLVDSFMRDCARYTIRGGHDDEGLYDTALVGKAVHLIRNPFDNLVARKHSGIASRLSRHWKEELLAPMINDTVDAVEFWCYFHDYLSMNGTGGLIRASNLSKHLYEGLPCYTEWYRIAQWHNRALEVINRLQLPVLTLYYENYTSNYNGTVQKLLDFLNLEYIHAPKPFISGKTYEESFDNSTKQRAAAFVQAVASPELWSLIRHYFEQY